MWKINAVDLHNDLGKIYALGKVLGAVGLVLLVLRSKGKVACSMNCPVILTYIGVILVFFIIPQSDTAGGCMPYPQICQRSLFLSKNGRL